MKKAIAIFFITIFALCFIPATVPLFPVTAAESAVVSEPAPTTSAAEPTSSTATSSSLAAESAETPLKGIDVSLYQGEIDWKAVRDDDIRFAFVRVGTSRTIDRWFDYNLREADANGLRVGVYWYTYATTTDEAVAEARQLLSLIEGYTVSYPVVVDIEAEEQLGLDPDELATLAESFCSVIHDAGYFPMVYASRNWFQRRIGDISREKWVAQYADVNTYDGDYGIWQYTSNGEVRGITTRVDMNYIYKDYAREIVPEGFMIRDDRTYFFKNYRKQKGLVEYNGTRYFFGDDFTMASGWINIDGRDCYFDPATGALEIEQLPEGEQP